MSGQASGMKVRPVDDTPSVKVDVLLVMSAPPLPLLIPARFLSSPLSRPRPAERQNEKASVFLPFGTRGTIRVFFWCFPSAGHLRATLFFWCKIVAFILRAPFASPATFLG